MSDNTPKTLQDLKDVTTAMNDIVNGDNSSNPMGWAGFLTDHGRAFQVCVLDLGIRSEDPDFKVTPDGPSILEVKENVSKLHKLLEANEVGLMSWNQMVADKAGQLSDTLKKANVPVGGLRF